jgi:uncharacterized membrane protein YqjE
MTIDTSAAAAGQPERLVGVDTTAASTAPPPSPWAALMALLADARDAVQGRVRLFSLELKKSGIALGQIAALGLLAAFMAHAAWYAIVVGLAWTAIDLGAPWWAVMIAVVVVHLGIAAFAVLRILKLAKLLGMPATMRHLTGNSHHVSPNPPVAGPLASAGASTTSRVSS